jgi:hypothetical protein
MHQTVNREDVTEPEREEEVSRAHSCQEPIQRPKHHDQEQTDPCRPGLRASPYRLLVCHVAENHRTIIEIKTSCARPNYEPMKRWLSIFFLVVMSTAVRAEKDALTYTVLLLRGTDESTAPQQGAKLVSTKLAERLSRFRWKHYWEVRRETVAVSAGRPAKLKLSKHRALEITQTADQVEMHLYRQGKVARTARQKVQSNNCEIMGGTDEKDSWFVVVRRKTQ